MAVVLGAGEVGISAPPITPEGVYRSAKGKAVAAEPLAWLQPD